MILRNIVAAMRPDCRVFVIETLIPPAGVQHIAKLLDLEMLVLVDGARERTEEEYAALFGQAGLSISRLIPTESPLTIMELTRA
jgi:hypothetical protein